MTRSRYAATLAACIAAGLAIAFASYRTAEKPAREPKTSDAVPWVPPSTVRVLP